MNSWSACIAAISCLSTACTIQAHAATPAPAPACIDASVDRVPFRSFRYDERYCPVTASAPPAFVALKNQALGAVTVDVGGEARSRVESVTPVRLGLRGGIDDQYRMDRMLLHVSARLGTAARVFGQVGYARSDGRHPRPAVTDENRGDVQQLFLDLGRPDGVRARLGRQEIALGSSRVVSNRASANIRRAFDGARVFIPVRARTLELLDVRPVVPRPGAWDDRASSTEHLQGAYLTRAFAAQGLVADAYALRFERDATRYQNASGRDARWISGVRVHGAAGRVAVNVDAIAQHGTVGTQRARAWALQSDLKWRRAPGSTLAIGTKLDLASGDRRAGDGRIETYQPVYAPPPFYMQSSLLVPANSAIVQPYVEWQASPTVLVTMEAQDLRRMSRADGFYQAPFAVQRLDDRGHRTGRQVGIGVRWTASPQVTLEGWLSRFSPTGALERAGARDTGFAAAMATYSF